MSATNVILKCYRLRLVDKKKFSNFYIFYSLYVNNISYFYKRERKSKYANYELLELLINLLVTDNFLLKK